MNNPAVLAVFGVVVIGLLVATTHVVSLKVG